MQAAGGAPNDAAIAANRALRVRRRFLKLAPFNSCQGGEVFLVQNDPMSCGSVDGGDVNEVKSGRDDDIWRFIDMHQLPRSYTPSESPDANNPAAESAAAVLHSRAPCLTAASAAFLQLGNNTSSPSSGCLKQC